MLLSAVLKKVTAKPLLEFATEALFEPLGIADFESIPLRKSGEIAAQGSLRLRPRDLAKIGQLVLDNGRWQGKQFVSEHWIAESPRPRVEGWYPGRYGHHWWTGQSSAPDGAMVDWIAGIGMGGQRLFIVPKFDLVVVINAWVTNPNQRSVGIDILDNYVLAAIRN